MRYYYLYCARAQSKLLGGFEKAKFKVWYSGYEFLGYIYGTQELYDFIYRSNIREQDFKQSFELPKSKEVITKNDHIYPFTGDCYLRPVIHNCYIIIDDLGRVRTDFDQLFQRIKYPKYSFQRRTLFWTAAANKQQGKGYTVPFQYHYSHTTQEKRHSLTPEESREVKDKYGFLIPDLKPKRKCLDSYNTYKYKRIGRSWKKHTKRKHQWKQKLRET